MDTIVKHSLNDECKDLLEQPQWAEQTEESQIDLDNNSTLLYIEVCSHLYNYLLQQVIFFILYKVEYVKDDAGLSETQIPYNHFEQHVSPLDPNMSSVARYSPVYNQNEQSNEFNPVIQLVSHPEPPQSTQALETISTVLNNNMTQYLHMVDNETLRTDTEEFQLVNDEKEQQQQRVELLITDQATGISYSVNTQDILVERCLDDEQLLSVLNSEPLLDTTDLLQQFDVNAIKTELNDESSQNLVQNYINSVENENAYKNLNDDNYKLETRRQRGNVDPEEQLCMKKNT